MFDADDIRDWRGQAVVDLGNAKIGTLEAVYFDTASQAATFASVQVDMLGRRRLTFVPLDGARVSPNHVRVMVDKKLVKTRRPSTPTASLSRTTNPRCSRTTTWPTSPAPAANAASDAADPAVRSGFEHKRPAWVRPVRALTARPHQSKERSEAGRTIGRVEHCTRVIEVDEGMTQAVCACGWRSERCGRDKRGGTMDALQQARDAADVHEWDAALS